MAPTSVRRAAYFLLAIAAAVVTSSTDVWTMFLLFLAGVVAFEASFFAYRRWTTRGR